MDRVAGPGARYARIRLAPAIADPVVGTARSTPKKAKEEALPAGILTAGSFDDNIDPLVFRSFAVRVSQIRDLGDLPGRLQGTGCHEKP